MKNEIIAKELIKLAKSLISDDKTGEEWQIWSLDVWGNEKDGFEVNDRRRLCMFSCNSEDEKDIEIAFKECLESKNYNLSNTEYEWQDENNFYLIDMKTQQPLFQVEKIL